MFGRQTWCALRIAWGVVSKKQYIMLSVKVWIYFLLTYSNFVSEFITLVANIQNGVLIWLIKHNKLWMEIIKHPSNCPFPSVFLLPIALHKFPPLAFPSLIVTLLGKPPPCISIKCSLILSIWVYGLQSQPINKTTCKKHEQFNYTDAGCVIQ